MLYEGVSRFRRITLLAVLIFMGLTSFCSGMVSLSTQGVFIMSKTDGYISFIVMVGITITLNSVTATLITLRILYFHIYIRKTVGLGHSANSPYMTILAICVESSALIVVFSLIFFILSFTESSVLFIAMQLLVHVYVLSPLLIIYRVAKGKAATIRQRHSESGLVVSALQFQSSPGNDEV